MNAMSIYLSTCRYVLQIDPADSSTWSDLYRLLPYLRQALTCCVCGNILCKPSSPVNAKSCQHHVCQRCIGGKMKVRPSCSWCKEWDIFTENIQLRIVLQCFKQLCLQLRKSPIYRELTTSHQGERFKISTICQEGVEIEDYKYPAKNKFANISSWPVPYFSFLGSGQSLTPHSPESVTITDHGYHALCKDMSYSNEPVKGEDEKDCDSDIFKDNIQSTSAHSAEKYCRISSPDNLTNPSNDFTQITEHSTERNFADFDSVEEASAETNLKTNFKISGKTAIKSEGNSNSNSVRRKHNSGAGKPSKQDTQPGRKICRCGTANIPNKLTCYCQRCPCYSLKLGCLDCKCRGCRNPYSKKKTENIQETQGLQEVHVNVET